MSRISELKAENEQLREALRRAIEDRRESANNVVAKDPGPVMTHSYGPSAFASTVMKWYVYEQPVQGRPQLMYYTDADGSLSVR